MEAHPYLVIEEETYEPPADPDSGEATMFFYFAASSDSLTWASCAGFSGLSLEELGLRALERIPRDRAIDGIQAFVDLRFVSTQLPTLSSHLSSPTEMV